MAQVKEVVVPDIGDFDAVDVVEVLVSVGDEVAVDDSLITLESDKASMEVPSPYAGKVKELKVKAGDQVGPDAVILTLEVAGESEDEKPEKKAEEPDEAEEPEKEKKPEEPEEEDEPEPAESDREAETEIDEKSFDAAYASPAVRRLARELGVDLGRVKGTGRKGRITREDVQGFVKKAVATSQSGRAAAGADGGFALPPMPKVDFSKYGEVETEPLSRIRRATATNLHRAWLHVPHVTQFDEADVTELEAFRQEQQEEAKKREVKLTLVAFLLQACAGALKAFPHFNASLDESGENLIVKKYVHIGVAVDTPKGLVVPVVRDVDRKGLFELAADLGELSSKARDGKLTPGDMQGAGFTISSLGGIGGTAFTPIVNAPEVAILGVSRAQTKPVWNGSEFVPRLMLPLSLSYDHRVIDGAAAARFTTHLAGLLTDLRRLLLSRHS